MNSQQVNRIGWWKCYKENKLYGYFQIVKRGNGFMVQHFALSDLRDANIMIQDKNTVFYKTKWVKAEDE